MKKFILSLFVVLMTTTSVFGQAKTEREIKQEKQAELERITAVQKREKRIEVGKTRNFEELCRICKERGYKSGWVIAQSKLKGIPMDWRLYNKLKREID